MKPAWKPKNPATFVQDYLNQLDTFQLANKHDGSPDQIKRYISLLKKYEGLPSQKEGASYEYRGAKDRNEFVAFLGRAKTRNEIIAKFGLELSEELLETEHNGYQLISNLNNYNERTFILLPEFTREIVIQPRQFKFHQSLTEDGEGNQAYLLVNIDESVFDTNPEEEIRIVPLFDVHLGHHAHKADKFLAYLRYIEETPNVYTWLGGDICENALDDGRGMTYEQSFGPSSQLEQATYLLSRIAHKILFSQPGNHEERTQKRAGIDPTKVIADRLKVPYYEGPVFCSIVCGERKWSIYSQHGYGNAQTKGGKMNSAGRPRKFTDGVDFFVSGHVHDPVVNSETVIREDRVNNRLIYPQQWTVIAPSFLGFAGTYAYRAGYPPPGAGGVSLHLYRNGDYEAVLRNRG